MILLVCGGRDYSNAFKVDAALSKAQEKYGIDLLVQGGAKGADALAKQWALDHGIQPVTFDACWDYYGRPAGPIRNNAMLKIGIDGVIAFGGGRGTNDMIQQAKNKGIEVWEVDRIKPTGDINNQSNKHIDQP